MLAAWWLERGWVLSWASLEKLWCMSSRQAKGLGSSAQRQLTTYPRQIFVLLEGLCWKPSAIHLGKSSGEYSNEYAVSSATLCGGGLLPWVGKTQGKQQKLAGCRTSFHALLQRQYWPCYSRREARNYWMSARRKVVDHSHIDVSCPRPKRQGASWMEVCRMCHSLDGEAGLLS